MTKSVFLIKQECLSLAGIFIVVQYSQLAANPKLKLYKFNAQSIIHVTFDKVENVFDQTL